MRPWRFALFGLCCFHFWLIQLMLSDIDDEEVVAGIAVHGSNISLAAEDKSPRKTVMVARRRKATTSSSSPSWRSMFQNVLNFVSNHGSALSIAPTIHLARRPPEVMDTTMAGKQKRHWLFSPRNALYRWAHAVSEDLEQRTQRLEKSRYYYYHYSNTMDYYCDDKNSNLPDWAEGMSIVNVGACHRPLSQSTTSRRISSSLRLPSLSKQEKLVFTSWIQCLTVGCCDTGGGGGARRCGNKKSSLTEPPPTHKLTTPEWAAIEQAVEFLAARPATTATTTRQERGVKVSNRLDRTHLLVLWMWYSFRNEFVIPYLLAGRYHNRSSSFSSSLFKTSTTNPAPADPYARRLRRLVLHVVRTTCCLLDWWLMNLTFVLIIVLIKFVWHQFFVLRDAILELRELLEARSRERRRREEERSRQPRRLFGSVSRLGLDQPHVDVVGVEEYDLASPAFFRVPRPGSSLPQRTLRRRRSIRVTRTPPPRVFRPRRLLLQEQPQNQEYETECPCCFEKYQINPEEFNSSARIPILSEACVHSYCLDCATRDCDAVMSRNRRASRGEYFGSPFQEASPTTQQVLTNLYESIDTGLGDDNLAPIGTNNGVNDSDDDNDEDCGTLCAVRCPFCREPDAFDVDRPILRPDAYAAYRKHKQKRQIQQALAKSSKMNRTHSC